jgi:hypothetical protein
MNQLIQANKIPEVAIHCVLSELLYIAEGTVLDDPKTTRFCLQRIQKIAQGIQIPVNLKPDEFQTKLAKVVQMLKDRGK